MKVESVDALPVRVKMKEALVGGGAGYDDYQSVLVKTVVDGETGWGEAMSRFSPAATAAMVKWVGREIEGLPLENPGQAWQPVYRKLRARGQTRGIALEAFSGVEISMWDAYARLHQVPLRDLLSKKGAKEVSAYAGSLFESRGSLEAQVEQVKSMGLPGLKLKVGFGVAKDLDLLGRVRRGWDEGMLVADANGAYDSKEAARAMEAFREFDLAWFEEPVPSNDFEGYARLSKEGKVPIGAGETWFAEDFAVPVRERMVDVLEPSVSRCGGVDWELRIAKLAVENGLRFSPMVGANSAISLAASLQVAAAVDCLCVEYDIFGNPLVTDLVHDFPSLNGGSLVVPGGNGLGIEVDERYARSNAAGA